MFKQLGSLCVLVSASCVNGVKSATRFAIAKANQGVAYLGALATFGVAKLASAQVTPTEQAMIDAKAQVTTLADTAVTETTSMIILVIGAALVLMVLGAGIAFVWRFLGARSVKC